MQQTRQHILEILKDQGQATVDEIVEALTDRTGNITAVTVRHHLEILRGDSLVAAPTIRRRNTPGRPQHVYTLTDEALELFPNNYRNLAQHLLLQLKDQLSQQEINVVMEGVAAHMTNALPASDAPLPNRLNQVVAYLTEQGYNASWETTNKGYMLYANNCPYHHLVADNSELCAMDTRIITGLLGGIVPRRVTHIAEGHDSCGYLIPEQTRLTE